MSSDLFSLINPDTTIKSVYSIIVMMPLFTCSLGSAPHWISLWVRSTLSMIIRRHAGPLSRYALEHPYIWILNIYRSFDIQGLPQSIQLTFAQRVIPKRVSLTFQGGFVGTQCAIYVDSDADKKEWRLLRFIYPEDVNKKQSFDLYPLESGVAVNGVGSVRLVFEQSSDFFGRITVYNLELEGITTAS